MRDREALFVCTGNICRSPMAERLLRAELGPDSDWTVGSAGLLADVGQRASEPAVAALREIGLDLSDHRSRPLTSALAGRSALIVVMTEAHRDLALVRFPAVRERMFLFNSFADAAGGDVADPVGMPLSLYRTLRDEMLEVVPRIAEFIEKLEVC